ncbi:MAG: acyltransferase family protein [Pirellulales bacterium]|nr:acyltransferase family protein [Pirellulales bacterium]
MVDQNTSDNFALAKTASIIMVVVGHFQLGYESTWILVTIGLFVFGFSSGFFTSAKYDERLPLAAYWQNKLFRLGPSLLVANAFLLGLFCFRGTPGIWTWQTPVSVLGLSGFLNWFGIPDASPFGAGLWFFTLLLIFYGVYPVLRWIGRSRSALGVVGFLALVAAAILNRHVTMGHALWLTAWSFIFGVVVRRFHISLSAWLSGSLAACFAGLMVVLNVSAGFKQLNFLLIVAMAAFTVLCIKDARLPHKLPLSRFLLSGCLMEIYVVHSYLYVRPTGQKMFDLAISLAWIIFVSWLLSRVARGIRRRLHHDSAKGIPGTLPEENADQLGRKVVTS